MKTIAEINEKIKKGKAVIVTAEEIIDLAKKKGIKKTAREVDVVTTATFSPMCSSGAYFNIGPTKPKVRLGGGKVCLNDIPCYGGFAAGDFLLGATSLPENDSRNRPYPGEFRYGGGHLLEDLVSGKDAKLEAYTYNTNCYPGEKLSTWINIKDFNEAVLFNPRNCYQNYNVAVNLSKETIYTYMGVLKPNLGNAHYCSSGQLSPLLNDPYYQTIGIGTRIFLGGGVGYVAWYGTQHNPGVERTKKGIPKGPAGTLALIGDLKGMNQQWLRGASFLGYGATLIVGIGIPIPLLNEEICRYAAVKDRDIYAKIVDYSESHPQDKKVNLGEVNYEDLKKGKITIGGRKIPATSLSSYSKAREIAETLKRWIKKGSFFLTESVEKLPRDVKFKPLKVKPIK